MAIPKQRHASSQYVKLTVREGAAVLRLVGFNVSLYLVSLYKCEPVRLFVQVWASQAVQVWASQAVCTSVSQSGCLYKCGPVRLYKCEPVRLFVQV